MTENHVQVILTNAFLTLNTSSGSPYIKFVDGKPVNVVSPNIPFTSPASKQFFVLSFLPGEPDPAGMGTEVYNRFDGVFQIDVYSSIGKGKDEVNAKYEALARLFERGKYFDNVLINKIYCPLRETDDEQGVYRVVIRIERMAFLPKQELNAAINVGRHRAAAFLTSSAGRRRGEKKWIIVRQARNRRLCTGFQAISKDRMRRYGAAYGNGKPGRRDGQGGYVDIG